MLTKSREPVEINCEEITTEELAGEVSVQNIYVSFYFYVNYSDIRRNNSWIYGQKNPQIFLITFERKKVYMM